MKYRTGVCQLDEALWGGLPCGVSEIVGGDACGKTTICLSVMREATLDNLPTVLVYTEGLPDKIYFRDAGPSDCVVVTPGFGEAAIEAAFSALVHDAKVVVIDSLTNLGTFTEQNYMVGDREPYGQKKLVFHGLSVLREEALKRNALVIVTSQLRVPIGALVPTPASSFEGIINNVCNTRIKSRRAKVRTEYGELAYAKIEFTIFRSLGTPPGSKTYGFIFNQKGFDRNFELLRALIANEVIHQSGSYFSGPDAISLGPGYYEAARQIGEQFNKYWRLYGSQSNGES
jgi:RecA/RadA recombinase